MIFLEYGIDRHGDIIHIDSAKSGITDLSCPYCKGILIAKKGDILRHHFAHNGDSCRYIGDRPKTKSGSGKYGNRFEIPYHDRFDLGLSPLEVSYLHYLAGMEEWQDYSKVSIDRLESNGFLHYNSFIWNGGDYELTQLGKIPVGKATLRSFADIQIEKQIEKLLYLEETLKHAWESQANYEIALADLRIYRAQLKSIYNSQLYFIEISDGEDVFYKIGSTSRSFDVLMSETRETLKQHSKLEIKLLRQLKHRAGVEPYFRHRYKAFQHIINDIEYFKFDRKPVLSDLTRLNDYQIEHQVLAEIVAGELSPTESIIIEYHRKIQHVEATRAGMEAAKKAGIHVGRPSGSVEKREKFLNKYGGVVDLLSQGLSLREVSRTTSIAINTVRKVKALLDDN